MKFVAGVVVGMIIGRPALKIANPLKQLVFNRLLAVVETASYNLGDTISSSRSKGSYNSRRSEKS